MPALSMFYGIVVRMQNEHGGKHHVPHLHAIFGENEVVMDFEGNILEGSLPSNKQKLLDAWIVLHKDELEANWNLLSNGEQPFKIIPLQ